MTPQAKAKVQALLNNIGLDTQDIKAINQITEGLSQQCFIVERNVQTEPLGTALNLPAVFVIKMFNSEHSYHNEVTALQALSNKQLAPCLLHAECFNNAHYILMEYVSGKSLASSDYSKENKLSKTLDLMVKFHRAFDYTSVKDKQFSLLKPLDFTTLLQALYSAAQIDNSQLDSLQKR